MSVVARVLRFMVVGALVGAAPVAAQQLDSPRALERLEQARLEHLRQAMELSDQETQQLARVMHEFRRQQRDVAVDQRRATDRLRDALREKPVDEEKVRRALEEVEQRSAMAERLRQQQRAELARILTPSQQAKFFLFNRQFDARLRELIAERRAAQDLRRRPEMRPPRGADALRDTRDRRPRDTRPDGSDRAQPDRPQPRD